MSFPAPCAAHIPLLTVWLPARVGAPISPQVQLDGHVEKFIVSKVTALSAPPLCDVTAIPASSGPVRLLRLSVEPSIAVQVIPSVDVYAVKITPARVIFSQAGAAPLISATCRAEAP